MRRIAGFVFDTYDDVDGRVLRSVVPEVQDLPPFVKTASRLTQDQIERLPDDRFALVLLNEGHKLKKYACVDQGNTALSVMYLLKQAHLLPPEAVKIAASNLIGACEQFGLAVPPQLKIASKTGTSPISGKSQKPYAKSAKVSKIQFPGTQAPKESTMNPHLGQHDAGLDDLKERANTESVPGSNVLQIPIFEQKEKEKTAMQVVTKQKSWRQLPYVDVSGWDPGSAEAPASSPAQQTLLDGHYPVDGYDQVKTAAEYFSIEGQGFHPRDRHEYCVKLASRMSEVGMEIPEEISRYGSTTYAADVDSYVSARRAYVHDEFHPALDLLIEKRAHVSPGTFAEALAEFDTISDLKWHWGTKVADPWFSTFGPSVEKIAAANWMFEDGGARVDEEDLKNLATNGGELIQKKFGPHFLRDFQKSPKTVFTSLPKPNQIILARMAMDRYSGTGTE